MMNLDKLIPVLIVLCSLAAAASVLSFKGQDYSADYVYIQKTGCDLFLHYKVSRPMTVDVWLDEKDIKRRVMSQEISGEGVLEYFVSSYSGRIRFDVYAGKILKGSERSPYTLYEWVDCK